MTATVDIHAHAMPMPVLTWLEGEGLADLRGVDTGTLRLDPRISGVAPDAVIPLARSQWDVEDRLAQMDAIGVDVQAVSPPPFLMAATCSDANLVREVLRRGNDALGDFVSAAPDRLVALGCAPVGLVEAVDEAARVLDLGMAGIAIGTRGAGRELDDDVNEPLWSLLAEREVMTFLHPSGVPDLDRLSDYYLPQLLGYPMETAIAVTRLVFAGVRERHNFPLVLAHGGGCLPAVRGRLDLGWERKSLARTTPEPPSSYLEGLHFDTAVFSTSVLTDLVDVFGVERVLLGTDFPFDLADREPLITVASLGLDEVDADRIRGGTAWQLLGLAQPEGTRS